MKRLGKKKKKKEKKRKKKEEEDIEKEVFSLIQKARIEN
jgi:hypothetical protein